eukprot:7299915-Heterocapsa_arctica.AAC.1
MHVNPGQEGHEGHLLAQMVRARANSAAAASGQEAHMRGERRETGYQGVRPSDLSGIDAVRPQV